MSRTSTVQYLQQNLHVRAIPLAYVSCTHNLRLRATCSGARCVAAKGLQTAEGREAGDSTNVHQSFFFFFFFVSNALVKHGTPLRGGSKGKSYILEIATRWLPPPFGSALDK